MRNTRHRQCGLHVRAVHGDDIGRSQPPNGRQHGTLLDGAVTCTFEILGVATRWAISDSETSHGDGFGFGDGLGRRRSC